MVFFDAPANLMISFAFVDFVLFAPPHPVVMRLNIVAVMYVRTVDLEYGRISDSRSSARVRMCDDERWVRRIFSCRESDRCIV